MLVSRYVFALGLAVLCESSKVSAGDVVPVLLWGGEATGEHAAVNPLVRTSLTEFERVLAKKVGGSQSLPVVVFSKENLCVEELTHQELGLNEAPSLDYLPAVDSPLSAFRKLAAYNVTESERPESVSDGQLVITPTNDLTTVFDIYRNLRESYPNLVAAVTGKSCAYSRSERTRRDVSMRDSTNTSYVVNTTRVLFYSSVAPYLKNGSSDFSQVSVSTSSTNDGSGTSDSPLRLITVQTTESSNTTVTLRYNFKTETAGYWTLSSVDYEDSSLNVTLTGDTEIVFPYNFSWHCSQNVVFSYINSTEGNSVYLNVTNIQVQVDASSKFSDTYDCVGFTTIPIWTGIFVTAILALIMIWGITMILDIRTMDRFDDPKGKTITISSLE